MNSDSLQPSYGVSFSVKQCRNFGIDSTETLTWLLNDAGFRRFRLMSYWNEIEKAPGYYDFAELDRQIALVQGYGGTISLCLGLKQPRWPEYHWPEWAKQLPDDKLQTALLRFLRVVVEKYKREPAIISWQLENEALLSNFGADIRINRKRLRAEYALIKEIGPERPVIMSTSNGWGIPLRAPIPDCIGFSYYARIYSHGAYHGTIHRPWLYRLRKLFIKATTRRPVFIHELQLEPWGPRAIWEMDIAEQDKSMSTTQIAKNLRAGRRIAAYPIDLWGAEWWYWRKTVLQDNSTWLAVKDNLKS